MIGRAANAQDEDPPALRVRRTHSARERLEAALAGFAHEVRTPLNGILALAELLAASDLPPRERALAATLKDAADHLASLTTVVVDGARAGRGVLVPRTIRFDPAALAHGLGASLAARAEAKGLTAEVAIAPDLPKAALGDPVLIRAAAENLIDNAAKFTERGRLGLEATAKPGAGDGTLLCFVVSDQGPGLSEAELKTLFQPFRQASAAVSRRFGGAGLGLAFTRQVARALGGDARAESRPGAGSRFTLTVNVDAAPAEEPTASDAGIGHSRALAILCVEDNPFGRAIFNALLTPLGHRLDFAGSGEAAVEAVAKGSYDAVLMDLTLPGIDGLEATRRIRALGPGRGSVPVIGVSGRSSGEEAEALRAGMDAFLLKPVTPTQLAAALAAVVPAAGSR